MPGRGVTVVVAVAALALIALCRKLGSRRQLIAATAVFLWPGVTLINEWHHAGGLTGRLGWLALLIGAPAALCLVVMALVSYSAEHGEPTTPGDSS